MLTSVVPAVRRSVFSFRTLYTAGVVLCCIGCAPSVRYTRGGGATQQPGSMKVPRDWDYRTTYALPKDRVAKVAESYLGTRYRYGGMKRSGTDCSGLVCMVYWEVCRAKMPRSSGKQFAIGKKISLHEAKCGDLVFFRGGIFNRINHVGIFISGKQFIHASSKRGVIYSNLDDAYYKQRFVEMRRIFK